MQYTIFNHGSTRKFPYNGMNIEIARKSTIYTHDGEMARALSRYPFVQVKPAIEPEDRRAEKKDRRAEKTG